MSADRIPSDQLSAHVEKYINPEIVQVPGAALPCCKIAQAFPNRKEDFIGIMVCDTCGKSWRLTRKDGSLRAEAV